MKQFVEWLKNAEEGKRSCPHSHLQSARQQWLIVLTLYLHPESESEEEDADWRSVAGLWFLREQQEQDAVERFLKRESFQKFPFVFPTSSYLTQL